eukprot:TRINITY_DN20326_c0_g1_i1.p1 TRINITY_DN20326_c0_g1~~TRINITY_DN20326_c0_g1_i1.p1  ORF type:complete len:183 (+),score=84.16 TRINITY_DN20326_c0_g1_i1:81-629(+)
MSDPGEQMSPERRAELAQQQVYTLQQKVADQDRRVRELERELALASGRQDRPSQSPRLQRPGGSREIAASGSTVLLGPKGLTMRRPPPPAPEVEHKALPLIDVNPWPRREDQLRALFEEFDKDKNGYLSKAEFMELYRSFENYGAVESESAVRERFGRYCRLGADKLTYDEFAHCMASVANR